jgi:hypothetical protein
MLREYVKVTKWAAQLTKRKGELRAKLQQYMEDREIESLRGEDGMGASFVEKPVHVSVAAESMPLALEWLEETGNQGIVQTKWKDGDIRRVVQEYLDRGESVPDFFKVWAEPGFQVRSGKFSVPELPGI